MPPIWTLVTLDIVGPPVPSWTLVSPDFWHHTVPSLWPHRNPDSPLAPPSLPCLWMLVPSGVLVDSLHLSLGSLSHLHGFSYLLFANCLQNHLHSTQLFLPLTFSHLLDAFRYRNFKLSTSKAKATSAPIPLTKAPFSKVHHHKSRYLKQNLKHMVNSIISLNFWNNS